MNKYILRLKSVGRIAVASFRGFTEDGCSAKASALTFYSLLSIVPVLAVAFGIAKGFGFEQHLESELSQKFLEQREVVDKLIDFAHKTLQNTESGLIAGIGVIVLFWTVLKLIGSIESSFNAIWKVKKSRTLARSFSDYLAMILFCPVFFAASSSLSVFVVSQIVHFSKEQGLWDTVSPLIYFAFHLFPVFLAWFLFTALYAIMPNTKVPIKYAFIAGVCAGTAYQIIQAIYIQFQIGLSSYGAIYGSFAALPLFLIWLNTSWLVALWGAEVAYHAENDRMNESLYTSPKQVEGDIRVLGLVITEKCINAFKKGSTAPSPFTLSEETGVSIVVVRRTIQQLVDARLLTEVNWRGDEGEFYLPGKDLKAITLKSVCDALNPARQERYLFISEKNTEQFIQSLANMDKYIESSQLNHPLESGT